MKIRVDLYKKEIRAIMTCVYLTNDPIENNIFITTPGQRRRLDKINLNDLYIKLATKLGMII